MSHDGIEILLVEDNFDDAELTIRALAKSHLANKLIHLKDGAEALDFLFGTGVFEGRKTELVPKVILLDLKLPKVTGMEVLKKIKENSLTEKIPVVVLTSSSQDPDIEHAYNLGANSYIVKPIEFDKFTKAISDLGMYWLVLNRHPL
jgi:two-component system, response regulator